MKRWSDIPTNGVDERYSNYKVSVSFDLFSESEDGGEKIVELLESEFRKVFKKWKKDVKENYRHIDNINWNE